MKIYDISQEVFGCEVFSGDFYNLTAFSVCAHNGTHIDAPFHFIDSGKTVEKICMERYTGFCLVTEYDGALTDKTAHDILEKASTVLH